MLNKTISDMTVTEAASKALELIYYGDYVSRLGPQKYGTPYEGTFEDYLNQYVDSHIDGFDNQSIWQELHYEGGEGSRDGWTGKLEKSYGGEGQGNAYWMVISLSDGITTRYFRKDGWYASYDGGHLDGETYEVNPVKKTVVFYE